MKNALKRLGLFLGIVEAPKPKAPVAEKKPAVKKPVAKKPATPKTKK
jgi:hypothetical protein